MQKVSGAEPYRPAMSQEEERLTIETNIGQRVRLADFRPSVTPLTLEERDLLIDQAGQMLEHVYVHLPLKRAIHGTDPIQRLRLLRLHHRPMDERTFQSAMIDIFTNLRDLHTNYILPDSYKTKFAFLPFRIEEYYDAEKKRRWVVSWVSPVNTDQNLKAGVEVTHWNGSPVELAVARNSEREAGSNLEAQRAQGVDGLTLRWLGMSLPPDEDWVVLTYIDGTTTRESKFDWEIIDGADRRELLVGLAESLGQGPRPAIGIDLKTELLYRARTAIFDAPATVVAEQATARRAAGDGDLTIDVNALLAEGAPPVAAGSDFPEVFPRFGTVTTPSGDFGYIRLKTFAPKRRAPTATEDLRGAVNEFAKIVSQMPPSGLILDVRSNGGGYVSFGELILQMLTPGPITPEPFHFLATPLTHQICLSDDEYLSWREPVGQAIETGASFSQGFPLTSARSCNSVGQIYQGPVVLVTDARCYSTTDIFTAGFQDHKIGTILGVHNNTGAGGANVWTHLDDLETLNLGSGNPFTALPQGAGMRVAVRRSTRVGDRSGVPVEDLGVVPDVLYLLTRNDVLNGNVDLVARAAEILKGMKTQTLRIRAVGAAPIQQLTFEAVNVDRIDILVNGRPVVSRDVPGPTSTINLPTPVPAGTTIVANGFREGQLVAATRLRVQ